MLTARRGNTARCVRRVRPPSATRCLAARSLLCVAALLGASAAAAAPVIIAYIGDVGGPAHAGARQGISEANAQGRFLGLDYELAMVADAEQARALSAAAIVADLPSTELKTLVAAAAGMAVINVTAEDDALRTACSDNLLHTIPSAEMRADAVQQWRQRAPQSAATANAWHHDFEKYAAAQLNNRYREQFNEPMNDRAWAGWAAVKVASDTVARIGSAVPADLLVALRGELAFDGQKGVDMSFRANGQLRQPLLLVEDDRIVGEAPVRGVVADDDLDSLGPADCPAP